MEASVETKPDSRDIDVRIPDTLFVPALACNFV